MERAEYKHILTPQGYPLIDHDPDMCSLLLLPVLPETSARTPDTPG